MIGRIITSIQGLKLDVKEVEILNNPNIGGVILFSRNFDNIEQLQKLTASIKKINPNFLICVDHEGGRVWRFNTGFSKIPPMAKLGKIYQTQPSLALKQAFACGVVIANELLSSGVDFSFTPVLDIDYSNASVIGNRAFSDNPKTIIKLAKQLIDGLHFAGMKCVGKHFPGHGFVKADSHLELPIDNRELLEMENDISVFKALAPNLDGIMPAHIIYPKIDNQPAGFSQKWIDMLRNDLNFKGVVISDDLSMTGAKFIKNIQARVVAALQSGIDIVLICNDLNATTEAIKMNLPTYHKLNLMRANPTNNYDKMDYLAIIKNIL